MNIFLREMNANKKALIIWSICMILFVWMGMQKYEAFVGDGTNMANFSQMMDSMPKVLQTLWGISKFDITSPIGFFGIIYPFLLLMGGIHAGMLGAGIISKEERDKTVEFLMAKPVSRNKIMTAKIMAVLTNLIVFNIVTYITSFVILNQLSNNSFISSIILTMIGTFFVQVLFAIIGVGFAAMSKNYKKSGSMTVFILLGSYLLSAFIDMSDKFNILSVLTPFKYFDGKELLVDKTLNVGYTLLTLAIIICILVFSYRKYTKRDLNF